MRISLPPAVALAVVVAAAACRQPPSAEAPKPTQVTEMGQADGPQAIKAAIGSLRTLADDRRAVVTRELAIQIRGVADPSTRLALAKSLANLSTEGDFGRDTLQDVTTTLAEAVKAGGEASVREASYTSLAQLAKYEGMRVALDDPRYVVAMASLNALEAERAKADFTLTDLTGHTWTRSALTGKVVLVNFWATWCPPCRKEMPDLDALAKEFAGQGLVVLAISDEEEETVRGFLAQHPVDYPILLDPGRTVSNALKIDSIPKTFLYDRTGTLVAQSIDMRTKGQFLGMLKKAGVQ